MAETKGAGVAHALWMEAAGQARLRAEPAPRPGPGEVVVRTLWSGISRGTERLVFNGRVPSSAWAQMRGPNMAGSFGFPLKYGYAAVGMVEGPSGPRGPVFCLHPHQDLFAVPAAEALAIPPAVPARRAVLAANMETALNIVWDGHIQPGDRVAVFGAGVVGCLVAYIAGAIPATEVVLIDIDPARSVLAQKLGVGFCAPERLGDGFDVVINVTGAPDALSQAIECAGQEARIVEASWYGEGAVGVRLGGAFHARRLTIASSQVGAVCAGRAARWPLARRLARALDLLRDDALDCLVATESAFQDLDRDYAGILDDPATMCHCVRY